MTHRWLYVLFLAGAAVVVWTAAGFVGNSPLALAVTALIGVVYLVGAIELRRFADETGALAMALADVSAAADANDWIEGLPWALRPSIRQSFETGKAALPQPALAPYLVGLLVMLGLIGTFVGLVSTLKGAVIAIENSAELDAIRAGLAAPVRGLGMAFGTSVAGVAASATLGLLATICRHQRARVAQQLGDALTGRLRSWTVFQRQQRNDDALQTLLVQQRDFQQQSHDAFRQLATELSTMLGAQSVETAKQLSAAVVPMLERSLSSFGDTAASSLDAFGRTAEQTQRTLGDVLEKQQDTIARQLGEHSAAILKQIADDAAQRRQASESADARRADEWAQQLSVSVGRTEEQLESAIRAWRDGTDSASADLRQGFDQMLSQWQSTSQLTIDTMSSKSDALVNKFNTIESLINSNYKERLEVERASLERIEGLKKDLDAHLLAIREQVSADIAALTSSSADTAGNMQRSLTEAVSAAQTMLSEAVVNTQATLASSIRTTHESLFTALTSAQASLLEQIETPVTRVISIAEQAEAHALQVGERLDALAKSAAQREDTLQQQQRAQLDNTAALLMTFGDTAQAQLAAVEGLAASSSQSLSEVVERFDEALSSSTGQLASLVAHIEAGGADIAALAEAFATSVEHFDSSAQSLNTLMIQLGQNIEASTSRSDDQMAYYLAQAREIIDHNLITQQDILTQWRELMRVEQSPDPGAAQALDVIDETPEHVADNVAIPTEPAVMEESDRA